MTTPGSEGNSLNVSATMPAVHQVIAAQARMDVPRDLLGADTAAAIAFATQPSVHTLRHGLDDAITLLSARVRACVRGRAFRDLTEEAMILSALRTLEEYSPK